MSLFAEYSREAPDELDLGFFLSYPPGGQPPASGFYLCYSGPENQAERAIAPLRGLGTPIADQIGAMDYVALQKSGDIDDPRARASYVKSGFISDIPEGLVTAVVEGLEPDPRRSAGVFYQQSGGAINRVASDATSFSHRDAMGNLLSSVDWPHGEDGSDHVAWIKRFWTPIEPFTQGFYTNDLELETTTESVDANYRGNYDRLVAVKNEYDPTNLFRMNANILPSV
jgi:FAD/FMN-containing dehydrogenase